MKLVRNLLPISRAGAALWAWRHRDQLVDTALFVARAAPRALAGDAKAKADALAEAKLRARLLARSTTRDSGITVDVRAGVARLSGTVTEPARAAARQAAESVSGIEKVIDLTEVAKGRRFARR